MAVSIKGSVFLLLILALQDSGSLAENDIDTVVDLIYELRGGITVGFQDQWKLLQKLRYQGVKRHREIINILKGIWRLTEEVEKLKRSGKCFNDSKTMDPISSNKINPLPQPPSWTSSCPDSFESVHEKCIFISEERQAWDKANDICRSMNSSLFEGQNETTYRLLREYLNENVGYSSNDKYLWVGGRYLDNKWIWVEDELKEGSSVDTKVWAPYEPRRLSGVPLCMALDSTKDYRGASSYCNYAYRFVCSI